MAHHELPVLELVRPWLLVLLWCLALVAPDWILK